MQLTVARSTLPRVNCQNEEIDQRDIRTLSACCPFTLLTYPRSISIMFARGRYVVSILILKPGYCWLRFLQEGQVWSH